MSAPEGHVERGTMTLPLYQMDPAAKRWGMFMAVGVMDGTVTLDDGTKCEVGVVCGAGCGSSMVRVSMKHPERGSASVVFDLRDALEPCIGVIEAGMAEGWGMFPGERKQAP